MDIPTLVISMEVTSCPPFVDLSVLPECPAVFQLLGVWAREVEMLSKRGHLRNPLTGLSNSSGSVLQ